MHREIPEVAADNAADGKNDDVGGMILAAPPQHPADPEDGEENRAELQSPCLIHGIPPMADIRVPSWKPLPRRTVRCITPRRNPAAMNQSGWRTSALMRTSDIA